MPDFKVFRPEAAALATPGQLPDGGMGTSVRVAEVTAERDVAVELPLPLHLLGPAGTVSVQLRTMLRRVAMGAGLARRSELVAAVQAVPNLPGLVSSPPYSFSWSRTTGCTKRSIADSLAPVGTSARG